MDSVSSLQNVMFQTKDNKMANVNKYDSYINIPYLQTYNLIHPEKVKQMKCEKIWSIA
jgi:hypothetical protein